MTNADNVYSVLIFRFVEHWSVADVAKQWRVSTSSSFFIT
jgi:hypothetical protein